METKIGYLEQLEHDLVRAAERERHLEPPEPPHGRRTGRRWGAIVAVAASFLVVAGLIGGLSKLGSSSDRSASTAGGGGAPRRLAGPGGDTAHQPFEGVVPAASPSTAPDLEQHGGPISGAQGSSAIDLSKVIRTGSMSVTVPRDGLGEAVDEVTGVADKQQGFVFSSSIATRTGIMVVHVPARRFDAAMIALRAIGTVNGVSVSAQDVTNQFIDLHARLKILEGRRRALERLYAQANTISETLRVEDALNQTQQNIEQIQGELNVIENRTSESTIRVQLREAGAPIVTTQTPVHTPSIGNAWDHAVAGFVGVIAAVLIGLGYLIPLAILGLLILIVVTLVRRRRATS
jgi:hypothetical protein